MRTTGVIHPELIELLAAGGHGDLIVLADAGLRIPAGRRRVDIGLSCGVPTMTQVLAAVRRDLVIEATEVATEFGEWSPGTLAEVVALLDAPPAATRPHAELMADMAERAYAYIKTGDCSAFSSVVLTCGVSFLDDAIAHYVAVHGREPL